jgi:hypothetical protein
VERAAANFCATCGDAVLSAGVEAKSAGERGQFARSRPALEPQAGLGKFQIFFGQVALERAESTQNAKGRLTNFGKNLSCQ